MVHRRRSPDGDAGVTLGLSTVVGGPAGTGHPSASSSAVPVGPWSISRDNAQRQPRQRSGTLHDGCIDRLSDVLVGYPVTARYDDYTDRRPAVPTIRAAQGRPGTAAHHRATSGAAFRSVAGSSSCLVGLWNDRTPTTTEAVGVLSGVVRPRRRGSRQAGRPYTRTPAPRPAARESPDRRRQHSAPTHARR